MDTRFPRPHDEHQPLAMSRRSFLLGSCTGAASLFMTPLWREGDGFAYAVDATDPVFKVVVVTAKEIGVAVVDVTDNKNVPIPDAEVKLTKRSDSSKTLSGTTDENGNIIFEIDKIADSDTFEDSDEVVYYFDGSVAIDKDGYRHCFIERIRCEGGSGMKVPTRLNTDNTPYFRAMSFNSWDIQYQACEFFLFSDEVTTHTLKGEIEAPGKTSATVKLTAKDNATGNETTAKTFTVTFKDGIGSFSSTDHYLAPNRTKVCLKKDTAYYFDVVFSESEQYRFETGLSVVEGAIDNAKNGGSEIMPALLESKAMPVATIPSSAPKWIAGAKFNCWCPSFPVFFWASPGGYIIVCGGKDASKTLLSNLEDKTEGSQSLKQQVRTLSNRWSKAWNRYLRTINKRASRSGKKHEFTGKISADFSFQAYAILSYDWDTEVWSGSFNLLAQASLSASITMSTTVFFVPVFLTFNPSLSATAALVLGGKSPTHELEKVSFTPQVDVSVDLTISIPLTVGIGVVGLVSAGIRGTGYLSNFIGFFDYEGYTAGHKVPRYILSGGFKFDVVFQVFVCTFSQRLWSIEWPRIYDSWIEEHPELAFSAIDESSPDTSHEFALGTMEDGSPLYSGQEPIGELGVDLSLFMENASVVTEAQLASTAEVRATQKAAAEIPDVTFQEPIPVSGGLFVAEMNTYGTAEGLISFNNLDRYEYEYIGDDEDALCETAGIGGISDNGGVKPTVDTRIVRNAYSNPLQKTILFHSTPFMFRIVSVQYKVGDETVVRTRLAAQRYEVLQADDAGNGVSKEATGKWSRPQIIDIPVNSDGITRIDTFDYDFDAIPQSESLSSLHVPNGIHILLVSGTRPKGDESSFAEVASSPLITWLVLDEHLQLTASYSQHDIPKAQGNCHSLTVPRITTLCYEDGSTTTTHSVVATFLRHSADKPEELFGKQSTTTAEFFLLCGTNIFQGGNVAVNPTAHDLTLSSNTGTIDENGKASLSFSIVSNSSDGTRISTATVVADKNLADLKPKDIGENTITASSVENVGDTENITNMQLWPNHSAFLTVDDGVLSASTFDPKAEHGALETRQVGPSDYKMTTFRISQNGNVLFFLENRDGVEGRTFDPTDFSSKPVEVSIHRIYACLLEDGLFSEPFVLADIKHPQDSLAAVNGGATYSFLASHITSMDPPSADLYYVDVPIVAAATPLSFVARDEFVEQGDPDAPFVLQLRNDGNVILKGCTIELCDSDTNQVVDTRVFYFTKDSLQASVWNPELADDPDPEVLERILNVYPPECLEAAGIANEPHPFVDPASCNVLLPGKSAQYELRFAIPSDWHGTKQVYLRLGDYLYDTVISATDDEGATVLQYKTPIADAPVSEITISEETGDESIDYRDPGMWKITEDGPFTPIDDATGDEKSQGGGEDNGASDGASSKGNGNNVAIAPTGDRTSLSVAALAATAAVAGLTAYSARRAALERENAEEHGASEESE